MSSINWADWSPEAFDKAADEGKFVLLSISAVWCHWCHVMDSTTYKDEKSIELINKHCITIRADVDKRPDIAERYNMGGYPTTVFLTSNGDLIGGGTYIPPDRFVELLERLVKTTEETKTIGVMESFAKRLKMENAPPATKLDQDLVKKFAEVSKPSYDKQHGGWGGPNKFPMPDLVRLSWLNGNDDMAKETLFGMAKLHDDKEGGFFRYATKTDWSEPHYEKMLETNAELIEIYAEAIKKEPNEDYNKMLDEAIKYITTTLKNNAFHGSQDADEEYYKSDRTGTKPKVDNVIYTYTNAMMISALLKTENDEAHKAALDALDWILINLLEDTELFHCYDSEKQLPGLFIDYAYLIQALLDAADNTKDAKYLESADNLTKHVLEVFWEEKGGFGDRICTGNDIGWLKHPIHDIKANSVMALNLHRLAKTKKDTELATKAKKTLLRFGNTLGSYGPQAATYALAVHTVLNS
ncbi:MAG: thioredoxin domain-containing protein [Candidatus Nanoarchaeia archaeon]